MSLAPATKPARKGDPISVQNYGSGGSGGSGGGAPPPKPIIHASGGGWGEEPKKDQNGDPIPGEYVVPDGVPVGTVAHLTVIPPTGYTFQSIAWAGGTNVKSYLSIDATDFAPMTMQAQTGVITTNDTYDFVVDANARTYTISVNVTYQGGTQSSSQLVFDSLRPKQAYVLKDPTNNPTANLMNHPTQRGLEFYDIVSKDGIIIESVTTSNPIYGGDLMFMQIARSVVRSYVDVNNVTWTMSGTNLIDVGGPDSGMKIGMSAWDSTSPLYPVHFWSLQYGLEETKSYHTLDPVIVPVPNETSDKSIQVGNSGNNSGFESFTTFLMYKPLFGVWVPLSKFDWGWKGRAVRDLQTSIWGLDPDFPSAHEFQPPTTPVGTQFNDLWPSWTGRTNNLNWEN